MNRITYSKQELAQQFRSDQKLGEIFRILEKQIQNKGEIICRFSVNGIALSEQDEKKFADFEMHEIELLEVDCQSPETLLSEVTENWTQSLPRLIKKSDQLSQTIRFNGIENQMAQFVDIVDSCQFLVESLMSLRSLCQGYEFFKPAEWKRGEEMTARAIAEVLSAFEKKDLVLLADVLEYDLGHCLQNWLETLTELDEHVKRTADVRKKGSTEALGHLG
jgi:hypothetical protein